MNLDYSSFKADETLYYYQEENKQKVYNAWFEKSINKVMLQMPTATGKTRVFTSIIKDLISFKGNGSIVILVHRDELVQQTCKHLDKYNIPHGRIDSQNTYTQKNIPVYVAMVQTLVNRLNKLSDINFDYIIIDEAHHTLARSYRKIINKFHSARILGLTATPYRLNGEGFNKEYDLLIASKPISNFISEGYLSNYRYISIKNDSPVYALLNSISDRDISGDYAVAGMMRCMSKDYIRAGIIDSYLTYAKGKKGIVYTINQEHNYQIVQKYKDAGINAVGIDSKTPSELRERYIQEFKDGQITVICNVNIFSEGFDCPDVEFIQLARPTLSLSLYLQQIGRGLRISNNKENVIILDNVGLYNRFGLPNKTRNWQMHFDGYYKTHPDNNLYFPSTNDAKAIEWMNYAEGNEDMHLIESAIDDYLTIDYSQNYENEFYDYLCRSNYIRQNEIWKHISNYGEGKNSKTAKSYISIVNNYINKFIQALYNQEDLSLFNSNNASWAETNYNRLNMHNPYIFKNNERKNLLNIAIKAYIRFCTYYNANNAILNPPPTIETTDNIKQSPLSLINMADIAATESTLAKLGLPPLEELLKHYNK